SELDVTDVIAAPALLADLAMHVTQAFVGIVVQILSIDERGDQLLELASARTGQRAGLEPRIALPGTALCDQILLERGERRRQRAGIAVWTQSQVGAEDITLGRRLGQGGDDSPSDAIEKVLVRQDLRPARLAVLRIDEDEVDVGRDIELAAAELAHTDDDHLLSCAGVRADRLAMDRRERARMRVDRRADRQLREP